MNDPASRADEAPDGHRPRRENPLAETVLNSPARESEIGTPQCPSSAARSRWANSPLRSSCPKPDVAAARLGRSTLGWTIVALFILGIAWYLGPAIVTRYQYAFSMAELRAEYDHARKVLGESPEDQVSVLSRWVVNSIRASVVSIRPQGSSKRLGGQGSGVIMSNDGYVVTNAHVVGNATLVDVDVPGMGKFQGTVMDADIQTDIAVVKLDSRGEFFYAANWGNSDSAEVGSLVWAVGSPFGLNQTVTTGIISADYTGKPRVRTSAASEDEAPIALLQTDAAINPGNSGGPLVNSRGEVIGINSFIVGESYLGIGFAIPSNRAREAFERLVNRKLLTRSFLGIYPVAVRHPPTDDLRLASGKGVEIDSLIPEGPAAKSDLRVGDIILDWGGQTIESHEMIYPLVRQCEPNSQVEVTILRGGEQQTIDVTVGAYRGYDNG